MIHEIAQKAIKAIEKDCDAYEIYIDESKFIQLDSKKEELNFAKEEIECGVGIRVIKDNRIGFAFTSNMDKIIETATQAIENTKLNKIDENYAFAEVEKVPNVKNVYDKKFKDLHLDECIEFLKNAIDCVTDTGCEITGSSFSATILNTQHKTDWITYIHNLYFCPDQPNATSEAIICLKMHSQTAPMMSILAISYSRGLFPFNRGR